MHVQGSETDVRIDGEAQYLILLQINENDKRKHQTYVFKQHYSHFRLTPTGDKQLSLKRQNPFT